MYILEYVGIAITMIAGFYIVRQKETLNPSTYPVWIKTILILLVFLGCFFLMIKYTPLKEALYHPIFDSLIFPITGVIFSIHGFMIFKRNRKPNKSSG